MSIFESGTQRSSPFCVRMRDLFERSGLSVRDVARIDTTALPPWQSVNPQIDLSLADARKGDILTAEYRSRALELFESYAGYTLSFTDGSKSSEGAGSAFVTGETARSFSLPDNASVFTSELVAIFKALCFIEMSDEALHLILIDSLSSLLALRRFYPSHPLIQDILVRLTSISRTGKSVHFCWIPSHVGIAGNGLADAAARRAASAQSTRRFPLPARDFYPAVSCFLQCQWQRQWAAQSRNKLRELKPTLKPWLSSSRRSRLEEVIQCRLRIGHTYATHGYLLRGEDRPMCSICDQPLSVAHVLLTCQRYRNIRSAHLGQSAVTLRRLLGDESRLVQDGRIFSFIRAIAFPVIFSPY